MSNTKSSTSGCFSAVFSRFLCSGSPQTHPSDHIVDVESNSNEFAGDHEANKPQVQVLRASARGPGIVARLMGLDSLPEKNWVHEGKTPGPGPVTRSRSVNFMDYMLELDLTQTQAKHRRVKTSASFREVPQAQGLHHNQNHEFFVVYLDNVDKNKEAGSNKPRKYEKGDGSTSKHMKAKENVREKVACKKESKEKNKKISKLKNEPRRVSGKNSLKTGNCINGARDIQTSRRGANSKAKGPLKMVNQKQDVSIQTRKKKNQLHGVKKVEFANIDSQGSSLVSVLHANDFAAHQENDTSENSLELKSKKKCSSISMKYNSHTVDNSGLIPITEGLEKEEFTIKNIESTDSQEETEYYIELVGKPFKLTEEDIKLSNWIDIKKVFNFEDFEEICAELGEQILDLMLHQVADELMGLHMQIIDL